MERILISGDPRNATVSYRPFLPQCRNAWNGNTIHKTEERTSSCKHWLSGLLHCSICGASLSLNRAGKRKSRGDTFVCWKYTKGMHNGPASISLPQGGVRYAPSLIRYQRPELSSSKHIKKQPSGGTCRFLFLMGAGSALP